LTLEEASGPGVEVWPDNLQAVNVFIAMATQWRVGPAGAVGLDYAALEPVMRMTGVPPGDVADVFGGVRIMEDAALEAMRKGKK
jgi:hypothetical protein